MLTPVGTRHHMNLLYLAVPAGILILAVVFWVVRKKLYPTEKKAAPADRPLPSMRRVAEASRDSLTAEEKKGLRGKSDRRRRR
jgi:hypothetical protein